MNLGRWQPIWLLVTLVALALLAACAPPTLEPVVQVETVVVEVTKEVVVTPTPEPLAEGAKIVLRVGTGDSGEGLNPHQQIIGNFEDANPDILVQLEAVAGRDYYTRLLTQIAAKDAPDIMQVGDDAVPMFVESGAFLPLDEFIMGQYPLDLGMYLPGVVAPGSYQEQQYLLPKDFSPLGVYYNKTLFDAAQVPYPEDGWTWDDLLATAQALTQDTDGDGVTDIWGLQLPANWTTGFEYWVAAAGGQLISEDGTTVVGFMDSPEAVQAVTFYRDLYNTYQVAPPPADMSLFGGGNSEFDNGQAAMRLFGRWPQAGYKENPNIDLGVVGPPAGAERANVLFWGGFGIASTAENPEAAWRFLRYYVGEEGSEVWKDWAIPPVQSVAESSGLADDPIEGVWINELNYLVPRAYTFTPFWNETVDPALRRALETVLIDPEADVAAVMQQAAQEAQAALDEQLAEQ